MLIINLNEQHAYKFFQSSDIAKDWHFCTLIIVNISVAPPLDPKTFDIKKNHLKTFLTSVVTKIRLEVGAYAKFEKITCNFANLNTKVVFCDNHAIYDVIMQEAGRK